MARVRRRSRGVATGLVVAVGLLVPSATVPAWAQDTYVGVTPPDSGRTAGQPAVTAIPPAGAVQAPPSRAPVGPFAITGADLIQIGLIASVAVIAGLLLVRRGRRTETAPA